MVRLIVGLLLALALLGNATQAAAFAGTPAANTALDHMAGMADCMAMMGSHASESAKPKQKGCTPATCLNFMLACSGLAAIPAVDAAPMFFSATTPEIPPTLAPATMVGQTSPPDIRPPIA
jgi:hypothetical protein